jgi:glycosyltransferase 2 family protein
VHTAIKTTLRFLGFAIGLAALAYFSATAFRQFSSLPPITWGAEAAMALAGAIFAHCGAVLLSGYGWCLLLRLYASPVRPAECITIFALAQFARYLPGNIAHYAGRVALGKSCSIPSAASAMSLLTELGWALVAAASVAAACFGVADSDMPPALAALLPSGVQALLPTAALAVPIIGAAGIFSWQRLHHGSGMLAGGSALLGSLAGCFGLYCITFLLIGLAGNVLAAGVFGERESHFVLLTGAFAASWMAGLLAFGAPAGIGVREVVLLGLLSPAFGPAVAGSLAVALRATGIAADGLMFVAACILSRRSSFFSGASKGENSPDGAGREG